MDHELENPKRLKTLACSARFPRGNFLLHKFVLDNSVPNGSVDESCLNAVLRSMSDVPGTTVNAVNCAGYTALHLSVLKENLLMVRALLSCLRNIDVDAESSGKIRCGRTALQFAAESGNLGIVEELCNKGAAIDVGKGCSMTPLCYAAEYGHLDAVKLLVSKGADVNLRDGWTPLSSAVQSGDAAIVEFLLSNGAEVESEDKPLHLAVTSRSVEIVECLLRSGADVNAKDEENLLLEKYIWYENHRFGWTPLDLAVRSEDAAMLEFLISNGAEVESYDMPLHRAVASGSVEIVECLLRSGADVNAKDEEWLTPLHLVASQGRSEMAKLLLDRGADANARNDLGRTPLHFAVGRVPRNSRYVVSTSPFHFGTMRLESVITLLDGGADMNVVDYRGATPLHYAVDARNYLIREFTSSLRPIAPGVIRRENFVVAESLIEQGADLRAIDEEGRTPLYDAACCQNDEWIRDYDGRYREIAKIIRTLLEKGADVSIRNERGLTPLDLARNQSGRYQAGVRILEELSM